ncbi:MAG: DNA polymerase III subunit delta' [Pseudomonadota bacterium]
MAEYGAGERAQTAAIYPWFEESWMRICDVLHAQRMAHALLLDGVQGTGRTAFSLALAQRLLCASVNSSSNGLVDESPSPDKIPGIACGTCKSCTLFVSGSHPDFLIVEPESSAKSLGVDAIRRAIEFANKTPAVSDRKVLLLMPAEQMTRASANALLKSLEEPSPSTVMLLVTQRGAFLPATIRSRCQRWNLPAPTPEQATGWVDSQVAGNHDTDELAQWSQILTSRPLALMSLIESDDANKRLALHQLLSKDPGLPSPQVVSTLLELASDLKPAEFLELIESRLVGALRHHHEESNEFRKTWDPSAAFELLDRVRQFKSAEAAGSNPHADLLFHNVASDFVALWSG